jgi:DDE superfamily endonuclease
VRVLVGDSGYPLEPWLLTPLSTPTTPEEETYNAKHTKTRVVVERCFGLLKSRFRCLDKTGGTLLYTPEKTCRLIIACAVLHNFCIGRHIPAAIDNGVVARAAVIQPPPTVHASGILTAVDIRRSLMQQF